MYVIGREHQHFLFDRNLKPALTVKPGAEVIFETMDACCGEVRTVEQFMERRSSDRKSNPMTGPVFIEGAEPGQTLQVEIINIELDEEGFQLIGPQRAIVRDEIEEWSCYIFKTVGKRICFPNGMEIASDPVVGQFGNAPAGLATNCPNPLGGNLDSPVVRKGARLYIPIEMPGALFSLGDIHACQGDGEVVGAPEIGARVTVRLNLLTHKHSDWCMVEDETHWHTLCTAEDEYNAARLAVFENANFIADTHNVKLEDALIALTLLGKLSMSRIGKWGSHGPVVCSSFSKQMIERAFEHYQTSVTST